MRYFSLVLLVLVYELILVGKRNKWRVDCDNFAQTANFNEPKTMSFGCFVPYFKINWAHTMDEQKGLYGALIFKKTKITDQNEKTSTVNTQQPTNFLSS